MKVLITNATGLRNKGVEALVKSTIRGILRTVPESKFTVLTTSPDYDASFLSSGFGDQVRCLRTPPFLGPSDLPRPMTRLLRRYPLVRKFVPAVKSGWMDAAMNALVDADVVVSTGGDIFSSDYGDMHDHLMPIFLAQRLGKPIAMLGHSIGPFKSEAEIELFRAAAKGTGLITLREPRSYKYLRDVLGREHGIHLTADVAFSLEVAPSQTVDRLAELYGVPRNRKVIGFAISQGISNYAATSHTTHFEVLRDTITKLRELGHHILLIPHVSERHSDDRLLVSRMARELGFGPGISCVTGDHSAEELKGLIGLCSVLVAERTHAAIGGMSQGVPTLNVAYSVKAYGITDDVYGASADLFRIGVDQLSAEVLFERVLRLDAEAGPRRQELLDRISAIQVQAEGNYRLFADFMAQLIGGSR